MVQVFADHKSLLDSGMCDVVVIATPNMTHAEILLDVLAHPKAHHVLVEKPLCTTIEDCFKVTTANSSVLAENCIFWSRVAAPSIVLQEICST